VPGLIATAARDSGRQIADSEDMGMNEVLKNIMAGFAGSSALDQANLALGICGVVLMIRRSLWAFPVGLAAVAVQSVLFYRARLYADATLQIFFFGALAWGWWNWRRATGPELPVTRLTTRGLALTLAAAVFATAVWAMALRRWTDAAMPWRDAGIASFSVAAQVLQARKKLENLAAVGGRECGGGGVVLEGGTGVHGVSICGLSRARGRGLAGVAAGRGSEGVSAAKRIVVFGPESTGKTTRGEASRGAL